MNQKKIVITAVAALIAFAAGYGLLGMAAPDASGAQTTDVVPDATLQAVLANVGNAGDLPANVIVVDAPAIDDAGRSLAVEDDDGLRRNDDHDDYDDRYENDHDHDDDDHDDDDHDEDDHDDRYDRYDRDHDDD